MKTLFRQQWLAVLLLVCIVAAGAIAHWRLERYDFTSTDVYFTYVEGKRILAGENPYARVLLGNMRENQKYATYFPAFYLLAALTQQLGLREFLPWITFWRGVFLACNMGIACVIFLTLYRRQAVLAAIFSALFWLFNRWTAYLTQTGAPDYIAIFLLLLSLLLFRRHRTLALVLYGVSLSFKELAILMLPLYLIWTWQAAQEKRLRAVLIGSLAIAAVPAALSLPFIAWNAEGFVKSIVFSATRDAAAHFEAPSFATLLGFSGLQARLFMLFLLTLVYVLAWQRTIGMYIGALLTMAVFIDFNAVLFLQYFGWLVPFVPLSIADLLDRRAEPGTPLSQ